MYHTRILLDSLQRAVLVSVPMMALAIINPASGQLYFNRPAAKMEALSIIERRLADPDTRSLVTAAQWNQYGDRVADALAERHEGIRQGALRMVVQYGPYLNLRRSAVFDLVRMYRGHANDRVRRMAVVALAQTGDGWAMDFLKRSVAYEKDPAVRHTLKAVVYGYRLPDDHVVPPQTALN